ncbi:MAG TPA: RecQ family ATP-dependent DNA helicase [Sphaerochaeta sp.]|nr:RecQ family ATP-dependent DNA helicase [Sphaerochaeta sp.]
MDLSALAQEHFGIPYLRPFQELVVRTIAENTQSSQERPPLCVILPTGSGKSLCYMLPALLVQGLVIIVYPLRALLSDQKRRFAQANIPAVAIHGGQSSSERTRCFTEIAEGAKAVLTNAETLAQGRVLQRLMRFSISLIVVDEVHTINRWGRGFRPSLAALGPITAHLSATQILLFTATADSEVLDDLKRIFGSRGPLSIIRGSSDRPNITYHRAATLSMRRAISTYTEPKESRPALIFCRTRKECEALAAHYRASNLGVECTHYHAGRPMSERLAVERWYLKSTSGVLFATNAFGMGVDKADIRLVIHTHATGDPLSYLQESGRAGRDGRAAYALLLYTQRPTTLLAELITGQNGCIRSALLSALSEELEHCSGCDGCAPLPQAFREGEEAIRSAVRRRPLHYTASSLQRLLCRRLPFDRHSGQLSDWHPQEVAEAIATLLSEGVLQSARRTKRLFIRIR